MLDGVNNIYINVCEAIKKIITPELRNKIENKALLNKDITAIVNSVLVTKNDDGSYSVERRDANKKAIALPNEDIVKLREEMALIRTICIIGDPEVQIIRERKHKLEDPDEEIASKKQKSVEEPVAITRTNRKRKAEEREEEQPAKKQMQEKSRFKINEVGDMFSAEAGIPDTVLGMMAECIDLTSSAIIDFVKNNEEIPEYLKQNLSHLDLSNPSVDFVTFATIINEFKNLKSIKLPVCADNSWVLLLSRGLPNLKALDLSNCRRIHSKGIDYITAMKSLKSLNLSGNEKIGKSELDLLFRELRLQELNLYHCTNVTDDAFENIGKSEESLQDLNIGVTYISDKGLAYIVDGVKGLRRLSLSYSKSFTDEGLDNAIQGLKDLEHLDISGTNVSDRGLVHISQRHNTLQNLILASCVNITGEFLSHIDQNFEVLKEFSLNSTDTLVPSNLKYMTGRFPALENLDLSHIKFDDELIGFIVQGAVKLESLNLSATNIGNTGLITIAFECPKLKKLVLDFCKQQINAGICAILDGCKILQELSLDFSNVDDAAFETIANEKRKLIRLSLNSCSELSVKSFVNISKGCPNLKFINIARCIVNDVVMSNLNDNTKDLEVDLRGRNIPRYVEFM